MLLHTTAPSGSNTVYSSVLLSRRASGEMTNCEACRFVYPGPKSSSSGQVTSKEPEQRSSDLVIVPEQGALKCVGRGSTAGMYRVFRGPHVPPARSIKIFS